MGSGSSSGWPLYLIVIKFVHAEISARRRRKNDFSNKMLSDFPGDFVSSAAAAAAD